MLLPILLAAASLGAEPLLRPGQAAVLERHAGPIDALTTYDIDQAIDDVTGTFASRATIRWTNDTGAAVSTLPLLLHPNAPAELGTAPAPLVRVTAVDAVKGPAVSFTATRPTRVDLRFALPVAPGEQVAFRVHLDGRLRPIDARANDALAQALASLGTMSSPGGADYGLLGQGDGLLVAASAYPMVAPYADGAFVADPPARMGDLAWNEVGTFRVRTVVPAGLRVVTNLVDHVEAGTDPGSSVVVSQGTGVRDFVLVGGRDLQVSEAKVGDTVVRSWYRGKDERAGKEALEVAGAALTSFESRFGDYPYTELDVAEATLIGGAGGVEFNGLVLVAGMLYRDPAESQSQLAQLMKLWGALGGALGELDGPSEGQAAVAEAVDSSLEFTVAHEVAHQWFACLVGADSRRYPTVDEPLAQYLAGLAFEDRHGAEAARTAFESHVKMNYALYRALGGPDRPVLRDTTSYATTIEYAALVYGKAPYAWQDLRARLGDDTLHRALRATVERYAFDTVTTEELVASVHKEGGPMVRSTMRRWLEEAHGDEDLGLTDPSATVLAAVLPPESYASLDEALVILGLTHDDLVKMMFGGGLPDAPPMGLGINPGAALDALGE